MVSKAICLTSYLNIPLVAPYVPVSVEIHGYHVLPKTWKQVGTTSKSSLARSHNVEGVRHLIASKGRVWSPVMAVIEPCWDWVHTTDRPVWSSKPSMTHLRNVTRRIQA
jgi:hypothetical protein